MKRFLPCLLIAAACLVAACQREPGTLPPIEVRFSPKGGCTEAIVKEIGAAQTSLLIQAYSFTSAPIAEAVVEAHQRGVRVEVILDASQKTEKYSSADFLLHAGIAVLIDSHHAIAHNKIILIDDQVVVTGSFNFTKSAEESNTENLLIIRDHALAEQYTANWNAHAAHSEPYVGKQEERSPHAQPRHEAPRSPPHAGNQGQNGYVSAAGSQVFHLADCPAAARISAAHLVRYATRDEALAAGKKPCRECEP